MQTIEAAKGRWGEILSHYNLQFTNNRHIQCPLCERKGSKGMRINEYRGDCSYICVCGSGSGFNLIMEMTGRSFAEVAKEIDAIIGNDSRVERKKEIPKAQRKTLSNLQDYRGTDAEIYLKGRGIVNMPQMSISYSPEEMYYNSTGEKVGMMPAMIAKITDSLSLEVLQIHITYLKNGKKFDRKVKGIASATDYKTPCIRLFQAEKTLGIAEGIESALSAHDMYDVPTWSVVNSGFMKKFRAPLGVTKLMIFADNDRSLTGHSAAFECARANLSAKNDVTEVSIIWPDELGDFNDLDDKENICMWESSRK